MAKRTRVPGTTLSAVQDHGNRTYGEFTCMSGDELPSSRERLPTGIFDIDLALNGGLLVNQVASFNGGEAGGKTSAAMNVMAIASRLCWRCFKTRCTCSEPPIKMKSLWCDVEGTFDPLWAEAIGAPKDSYVVSYGEDAEQCMDIILAAIKATDCGLIVVDTVAAMSPAKIIESSAYDANVAGGVKLITDFIKKVNLRLIREMKLEHPIVVIIINQRRYKIGVLMGNPEISGGGEALKHLTARRIHFAKRALTDAEKKLTDEQRHMARVQRHGFVIQKSKSSDIAGAGEFLRCRETIYDDEGNIRYRKGDIIDHKRVLKKAQEYGVLVEEGSKWRIGNAVGTQADLLDIWREDDDEYLAAQKVIIDAAAAKYGCNDA